MNKFDNLRVPGIGVPINASGQSKRCGKAIAKIVQKCLGIRTLEARNSDGLDFYDSDESSISVWDLKEALEQSYLAGLSDGVPLGAKLGKEGKV